MKTFTRVDSTSELTPNIDAGHNQMTPPTVYDDQVNNQHRDDLARLSRVFNAHADLRNEQDRRINEWLKARLTASCSEHLAANGRPIDGYPIQEA
jgi:hypothetical protein